MNDLIRQAAGRRVDVAPPEAGPSPKVGDLGGGRGGTAGPRRRTVADHAEVNARIRRAARIVREASLPGGVNLNLDSFDDDPWS
jgi:hypothetical protein